MFGRNIIMALKAILDTVEGLADPIKAEYTQRDDGKFVLAVEPVGGFALEDVDGLKTTLSKVNGNFSNAEKELKKFGSAWDKEKGTWTHANDPAKVKTALAKFDEFSTFDPTKEADKIAEQKVEAIKTQLVTSHEEEKTAWTERNNLLSGTVADLLVKQQATTVLAAEKGDPELLMPHIERQTKVVEKDGKFSAVVVGADGNVRFNGKGEPMTIGELVAEMKKASSFGKAFEGEGTGGSGKLPNGTGGGNPNGLKRSTMTAVQKNEYINKHGQAEFLKLPK